MDFQRDYILRLIQMMGDLMRRIAELIDDLQRMRLLNDASRHLCGMTLMTAQSLTDASLRELLAPLPRLAMSELLYAQATQTSLPQEEQLSLLRKSAVLLSSLHTDVTLCGLRCVRLAELKRTVFGLLTAANLMDCARFFAQAEAYDEMEDALFQALAADPAIGRTEAIEMLRRAAKADATALARCRMTPAELRASAHELEVTEETAP